jgi:hypothetical protein
MASLDWAAIRTAVLVGVVTVGLAILAASLVTDDPAGWLVVAFLIVTAGGFLAAGAVAGWARGDTPMLHGTTAASLTAAVLVVVGAVRTWIDGDDYSLAASALTILFAATCGVAGALAADWIRRRRTPAAG